jgi:uncharacterized protein GlcG (DUF336 family)
MHQTTSPIRTTLYFLLVVLVSIFGGFKDAHAQETGKADCRDVLGYRALKRALEAAVAEEKTGLNLDMWATIVSRDGVVCAVAYSGENRGAQWPGSRVISAQKANTANAFSLNGLAISTANLFSAVQPGGSLYGLQESNPVDTKVAYDGRPELYGTERDPMMGRKIGGVNVFGGGLALYGNAKVIGALGVSGDTSCADHRIAWLVRHNLKLGHLAGIAGVSRDPDRPDNIVFDIDPQTGRSTSGFGHPHCTADNDGDPQTLPKATNIQQVADR